ncbi:c-type cytochrome, partial [Arthrospira platensis SPKY2]
AQPIHAGGAAPAAAAADDGGIAAQAAPDGAALYTQHCSACHQATGAGVPGAFPPIADHLYELVTVDRAFPAKVVLFGMMGTIQVKGATYMGMMPGLAMAISN